MGASKSFIKQTLVRTLIEQGGTHSEKAQLRDLQERVYALWEEEFNNADEGGLGRAFYNAVNQKLQVFDRTKLATNLGLQTIHKQGILHYWADLCEAGWTKNFKSVLGGEHDN